VKKMGSKTVITQEQAYQEEISHTHIEGDIELF